MKAKTQKLQRPQNAKRLFPEIATSLQIENLRKCDNKKGTMILKNTII